MDDVSGAEAMLQQIREQAKKIVRDRLVKADHFTDQELFQTNLSLPPQFKYQSVREMHTVLVKRAFDALGFSVELGLLNKQEATTYWEELHQQFAHLWPKT